MYIWLGGKRERILYALHCILYVQRPKSCFVFLYTSRLIVMRMHNLYGTQKTKEGEGSSDEESDEDDEEDEDKKPQMELAMMPHYGGINRVRVSVHISLVFPAKLMSCHFSPVTLCHFQSGDSARGAVLGCRLV